MNSHPFVISTGILLAAVAIWLVSHGGQSPPATFKEICHMYPAAGCGDDDLCCRGR